MVQIPIFNRQTRPKPDTEAEEAVPLAEKRFFPLRLDLKIVDSGQVISVQLADCLIVGRDNGEELDIDLTEFDAVKYGISRLHAAILYDGRNLSVEDLNSKNGTLVNGFPMEGGKPYPLRSGDELEFGHLRVTVQLVRAPL